MLSSSSPTDPRGISVAIGTYNGASYLEGQLDSIARQTMLPAELVVCDDVSNDGTVPLLEGFARRAPFPVHVHVNPTKLGAIKNFQHVFSLCSSPFIAYCDQDDVWVPQKLARCKAMLGEPGVVLVSHRSRLTDSELRPLGVVQPEGVDAGRYAFPHYPLRYWGYGHQMVFSRELVPIIDGLRSGTRAGFMPVNNLDMLIPIAAGMLGNTIFIAEPLMDFRRHDRAVSFAHTTPTERPQPESAVVSRLATKRLGLATLRETLSALREWLAGQIPEDSSDSGRRAVYAAHIDKTLRAVDARLSLHQSTDLVRRVRSFATALVARAYRDPRKGGAGRQQIMIDLLAVLKPAREPVSPPKADPTRNVGQA